MLPSIGPTSAGRATPPEPAELAKPQLLADRLHSEALGARGLDVCRLGEGLARAAQTDPETALAAQKLLEPNMSPFDFGSLLRAIKEAIGKILQDIKDKQVSDAKSEGAAFGSDLAVPKTPADAPKTIKFSGALQKGFDEQWNGSFPGGSAQEQGGTLVYDNKTGLISMINVGGLGSTSGSFTPDYTIADPKSTQLLGVFHTHPYDSGDTGISFSGADAAVLINEKHNIIMAQSGDRQFLLMRTDKTPAHVDYTKLNNAQNARISQLVGQGQSFAGAASQAASELATRYHLAYYEGAHGTLTRINP